MVELSERIIDLGRPVFQPFNNTRPASNPIVYTGDLDSLGDIAKLLLVVFTSSYSDHLDFVRYSERSTRIEQVQQMPDHRPDHRMGCYHHQILVLAASTIIVRG